MYVLIPNDDVGKEIVAKSEDIYKHLTITVVKACGRERVLACREETLSD